jgi:glycosyltransferase involved in cell wall biosynthesis
MGSLFFPRGGSAHVARGLARALGCDVTILSASADGPGDAASFYRGLDVLPVEPPLQLSYEDGRDRVFASLADDETEAQVVAWARALQSAGAAHADVLHLHHLTPINEAARRVAPQVPVVGHLHGTELLMLEAIEHEPYRWPYGLAWASRMREWAAAAERLIVPAESQLERVERLLGVEAVVIPNGYDAERFKPRPRGPHDEPQLLYVGRFTAVKRVNLLIEAYERARPGFRTRAPLVIVGGFPDEWEGEHPRETVARVGAQDVRLAGWHEHEALPDIYAAADVIVLPSVREQFGQVLVEGMACGLPAIAVDAYGPADIVHHGQTGWLVEPDDVIGLANALVEAVNRPDERARRGANAARDVAARFAWDIVAEEVAGLYDEVVQTGVDAILLRTSDAQSG